MKTCECGSERETQPYRGRDLCAICRYEAKAEAFYRATGMMAPGKDSPAEFGSSHSRADRWDRWEQWLAEQESA